VTLGISALLVGSLGNAAHASNVSTDPSRPVAAAQPTAAKTSTAGAKVAPNRCGTGYRQIDTAKLNHFGPTFGDVYLYYNESNGYNCAFTEKLIDRGMPTPVSVRLCRQSDGHCVSDSGNYRYYAGPVYLYAANTCVRWGGSVTAQDGREDSYWSPWEHCG
jgi:hypothetical protein